MPISLTYDDAKSALLTLATERPDYVYADPEQPQTCEYFTSAGEPGCIVGHVLDRYGLTAADLRRPNADAADGWEILNTTNVRSLVSSGIIEADEQTLNLLLIAQRDQDSGTPWGEAVTHAINVSEAADLYA